MKTSNFTAKWGGTCDSCGGPIEPGDEACFWENDLMHLECAEELEEILLWDDFDERD